MQVIRKVLIVLGAVALVQAAPAVANTVIEAVGMVGLVKDSALERFETENWNELLLDQQVYMDQWVRTEDDSALHVQFVDGSIFRLGSNSEAVIDEYVYNPDEDSGTIALNLGEGVFRFISGQMSGLGEHSMTIETPTTTLGIRGSDIIIEVAEGFTGVLINPEGSPSTVVTFRPKLCPPASSAFQFSQGSAGIGRQGCEIQTGIQIASDPGLGPDGGLNPGAGPRGLPNNLNLLTTEFFEGDENTTDFEPSN